MRPYPFVMRPYQLPFYNRVIWPLMARVRGLLNILNLAFFEDPYVEEYR